MALNQQRKKTAGSESGMSLVEMLVAMVVLLVGLVACMSLVAISIGNNSRSKQQSNSTIVAQLITEKIASMRATLAPVLPVTDCAGNAFNVNTVAGGSPLTATGDVDFSQAPVVGYQMLYTDCGTNARQLTYDIRWNIQQPTPNVKMLVVSAKRQNSLGGDLKYFSLPVTIRTLIGQGS
jgi:Tfp pilus assembly protein PilV